MPTRPVNSDMRTGRSKFSVFIFCIREQINSFRNADTVRCIAARCAELAMADEPYRMTGANGRQHGALALAPPDEEISIASQSGIKIPV